MKNLVISSCGINVFALLGSLINLNEKNILNNINSFYTLSFGSILIVMLTLKYTIDEIKTFFLDFNFNKLMDNYDLNNIIYHNGLSLGKNKDIIIKSLITFKLGDDKLNYTFKDLFDDSGIILTIFATCVEDKTLWKFSYNENNIPIWQALSATISFPYLFSPVKINNNTFIDGSIINNYPINYIPDIEIFETIGIYTNYVYNFNFTENKYLKYFIELLLLYIINKDIYILHKNTIKIDSSSSFELNFNIDISSKLNLINLGYTTSSNFIFYKYNINKTKIRRSNSCIF